MSRSQGDEPMDWKDYVTIAHELKKNLSESRYVHSLGVAYTASALAMRYGYAQDRALLAGLLHDCAKDLSDKDNIALIRSGGAEPTEYELENPKLLHAGGGYVLARTKYGLRDEELLRAIRYHTTGKPDMTLIEQIIYVADYIEPKRDHASNLDYVRYLAFTDLEACMVQILSDTVKHLANTHRTTDPGTIETYEYYQKKIIGRSI